MAKVKISEIKSENVKRIFRLPMSSRGERFLNLLTLTNDDIIETIRFAEIEYHKDKRDFYRRLVKTQHNKVKFNRDSFGVLVNNLFDKDRYLELIRNSEGLTKRDLISFVGYSMTSSTVWFFSTYYLNGDSKADGIDINDPDIAFEIVERFLYTDGAKMLDSTLVSFAKLFGEVFKSTHKDEVLTRLRQSAQKWTYLLTKHWDEMPEDVIAYFLSTFNDRETRSNIAKLKNAPSELKQEYYEKTGDESYLPAGVTDIFLF